MKMVSIFYTTNSIKNFIKKIQTFIYYEYYMEVSEQLQKPSDTWNKNVFVTRTKYNILLLLARCVGVIYSDLLSASSCEFHSNLESAFYTYVCVFIWYVYLKKEVTVSL